MKQYLDLMRYVRENGKYKMDRTGTGTYGVFGQQMRFDLTEGFPLVTTKNCHLKSIIHELLWFLRGDTNIRYLKENGVSIWDEWVLKGTEEYRQSTLKELTNAIKAKGLIDEFIEWNKPYWTTEQKDGYVEFKYPTMHIHGAADVPGSVYWAHPEYDAMAFAWAEERGVSTKTLIAGALGPVYGSQWRDWPVVQESTIDALIELACLGNGSYWGNSDGNRIAKKALLNIPGIVHHKRAYMSSGYTYADWLKLPVQVKGNFSNKGGIDQIANLIDTIKNNPDSRRMIVSAWNPAEIDQMGLPPCHALYQFYSEELTPYERKKLLDARLDSGEATRGWNSGTETFDEYLDAMGVSSRKLSCQLYQRKHNCALVA